MLCCTSMHLNTYVYTYVWGGDKAIWHTEKTQPHERN